MRAAQVGPNNAFELTEVQTQYSELKAKYNKVKHKCFSLSKENDFYN